MKRKKYNKQVESIKEQGIEGLKNRLNTVDITEEMSKLSINELISVVLSRTVNTLSIIGEISRRAAVEGDISAFNNPIFHVSNNMYLLLTATLNRLIETDDENEVASLMADIHEMSEKKSDFVNKFIRSMQKNKTIH